MMDTDGMVAKITLKQTIITPPAGLQVWLCWECPEAKVYVSLDGDISWIAVGDHAFWAKDAAETEGQKRRDRQDSKPLGKSL